MKRWLCLLLAGVFVIGASGCISSPLPGILFTYTNHHIYGKTLGSAIGSGEVVKKGESCSWSGLLLFPFFYGMGGSVADAMEESGITKIAVVDRKSMSILMGLIYMECVEVYGE